MFERDKLKFLIARAVRFAELKTKQFEKARHPQPEATGRENPKSQSATSDDRSGNASAI